MAERREAVYLDSSILIGAIIAGSSHSKAATGFCERVALERQLVIFSQIAHWEFANMSRTLGKGLRKGGISSEDRERLGIVDWNTNFMTRVNWIENVQQELSRLLTLFDHVRQLPVTRHVWTAALPLVGHYDIGAYDAIHVATARMAGVRSFATCDRHYESVDVLDVHICRDT